MSYLWLIMVWLLFGLSHSVLASLAVKLYFEKRFPRFSKYYRLVYNVLAIIIFIAALLLNYSFRDDLLWCPAMAEKITAVIFGMTGLTIMLYCIKKYFFEMSGLAGLFAIETDDRLFTAGLNRFVRHPLYSGTLLFVAACLLWYPGLANLISFLSITVYTIVGIRYEEKKLISKFGKEYLNYSTRVPMLFPSIFSRD